MKSGERQPDFLAVRIWSQLLIEQFKGKEHLFLDGICRSLPEAEIFTTAAKFYDRKPVVVYINVSRGWSRERLLARGRSDDDKEGVEKRLDWFEKDTYPAIEYFNMNNQYTLLNINGEQTIEEVHKEIMGKLGWQ
jgi:adenylate kinase family enzyme